MAEPMNGQDRKRPKGKTGKDQIDENLRRVYDDLLDEEVPERFEELLRKLRQQGGDQ